MPARVMGQFAIFCSGYRSSFVNLALVMGSALQKFALVMVKCWQFIAIFNYYDKKFRHKGIWLLIRYEA